LEATSSSKYDGERHDAFREDVEKSEECVTLIAEWFRQKGHKVEIPEKKIAPEWEGRRDYSDDGDLIVGMRIEVKGLNYDFTGPDDWPFGEKVLVMDALRWDIAKPKPMAIIMLNKARTHAVIVESRTNRKWQIEIGKDRRYPGYKQRRYWCPKRHVIFIKL
jgi:hypothetical protein